VGGTDDDEEIQEVDDLAQMKWEHVLLFCTDAGGRRHFTAGGCPTRDAGLQSGGTDACS